MKRYFGTVGPLKTFLHLHTTGRWYRGWYYTQAPLMIISLRWGRALLTLCNSWMNGYELHLGDHQRDH